jgi:hypothetical protein
MEGKLGLEPKSRGVLKLGAEAGGLVLIPSSSP